MVSKNLEIFKKFENYQDFPLFLQLCTESLLSKGDPNFERLENIPFSKHDCKLLQNAIQNHYKDCATKGQFFISENFPESLQEPLETCFRLYQNQIANRLVMNHIMESEISMVESFDWKLKWIIGTSKLVSIKEPILQVDLRCAEKSGNCTRTVNFEGRVKQIDELILCLNSVQKELET